MTSYRLRAYIFLTLAAAIWGVATPIIKFTLKEIDPLSFLVYRLWISAIISIIVFGFNRKLLWGLKKNLPLVCLYGFLATTLSLSLLFIGLKNSSVLDLTLLATVSPLLMVLSGVVIFGDKVTHIEKMGMLTAFAGISIVSFAPLILGNGIPFHFQGNILLIVFLIVDLSGVLLAKRLASKERVDPLAMTTLAFLVGAITLTPVVIYLQGFNHTLSQIQNLTLPYHLAVWYMAAMSGSVAYFLYMRAQKSIEISEAALFVYLQPIFSVPLAIVWLNEKPSISFWIGALLIAIGVFIAEYKKRKS